MTTRPRYSEVAALTEKGAFVKRTLFVALVVAGALLLWAWRDVLLLAFAAIVIACGLRGLAKPIARRTPLSEPWAIGAAGLIIVGVIATIFTTFGSQIAAQVEILSQDLPLAWGRLQSWLSQTQAGQTILKEAQNIGSAGGSLSRFAAQAGRYGFTALSGALDAFLVIIAAIFLALSPGEYRDGVLLLAPKGIREEAREAMNLSGTALRKWLAGTLISMAAITIMVTGALWALGVPAPFALGLLAGLGQIVPFVGPIVAAAPAVLLGLTVSPLTALWVALAYFAASTIEANILYPLIMKRSVSQPPVITLFSILAFGLLFGPMGVLLALPITVVLTVFIIKFYVNGVVGENVRPPGEAKRN